MRKNANSGFEDLALHHAFADILNHPIFQSMDQFNHHGGISCLDHTLVVAEITFSLAVQLNLDVVSATRGALLHDFYLYDWHTHSPGLHGFKHPAIARDNAVRYFHLNAIETDVILRHMWPLTPIPPRYKESFLVCLADKMASLRDYLKSTHSWLNPVFRRKAR